MPYSAYLFSMLYKYIAETFDSDYVADYLLWMPHAADIFDDEAGLIVSANEAE